MTSVLRWMCEKAAGSGSAASSPRRHHRVFRLEIPCSYPFQAQSSLRLGNEQPQFAKIRVDDVAIVGGDVDPVVTIEAGIRDRVGLQLEASGKRLVALRVERGPG